ncbi:putative MFS family arabinose efflux permease [Haloactinopolyspora alba]|uniref:Putative MFS family arabinose efflux permease n=1 Tax=Haloactinopolyspora alba TaxID=648780 RepID=A0A2P8E589_9ACTN|nr:MFS transporter [Haloactinopolyspora alba]PSL04631.1 putative MFS family arabinose efflux permease [Haloactinopolyspora alba]
MTVAADDTVSTLRWRGGYGRLWSAAVLSRFGDAVRNVAVPVVAAGLTTSPFVLSLVSAAGYLPWLLFGLLGGALADRVDRRRAMWTVDVIRGVLVAVFAVSLVVGESHIAVLMAFAFSLTTMQTLFDNAATAILPTLVPRGALSSANARLMTAQSLAGTFLGAPVAGVLIATDPAVPFAVDAATYLVAAALIASLPRPAVPAAPPGGTTLRTQIAEGLRRLWRDRLLRAICTANLLANMVVGGLTALLVLIVTQWAGASETTFGVVVAAYGAGAVLGGLVATRLGRWVGGVRVLVLALVVQVACLTGIGTVAHAVATAAGLAAFGFAGMLVNVHTVTLIQRRVPGEMLGRVSAASRTVAVGGAPLGALLAGTLAEATDVNVPAVAGAGLVAIAAVVVVRGAASDRLTPM